MTESADIVRIPERNHAHAVLFCLLDAQTHPAAGGDLSETVVPVKDCRCPLIDDDIDTGRNRQHPGRAPLRYQAKQVDAKRADSPQVSGDKSLRGNARVLLFLAQQEKDLLRRVEQDLVRYSHGRPSSTRPMESNTFSRLFSSTLDTPLLSCFDLEASTSTLFSDFWRTSSHSSNRTTTIPSSSPRTRSPQKTVMCPKVTG